MAAWLRAGPNGKDASFQARSERGLATALFSRATQRVPTALLRSTQPLQPGAGAPLLVPTQYGYKS